MKQGKLQSAVVNVFLFLFWLGVCASLGALVLYYNRFTDVFTMHGEKVRADLPEPYNLPLVGSTRIDLAGRRMGLLGLSAFWQCDILPEDRVFIAYPASPVAFHVELPGYIRPLRGLWQGGAVTMRTTGALERTLAGDPGHKSKSWGTTVSKGRRKARPYFDVTLPIDQVDMQQPIDDRAIEIHTSFRVTYPASGGSVGFRDDTTTLEHRFWLIPLSPSEIDEYKAVRRAYRLSRGVPTCLTGLGLAVLIAGVLCVGPLLLARRFGIK